VETLLVDSALAKKFYPNFAKILHARGVEIRGDAEVLAHWPGAKSATEADWRTEYLDLILSVKTVADLEEAITHINHYGSRHTDAIVTEDKAAARTFLHEVDSAVVLWNASTRFNDGGEFGFGAEIGISTDKLHARGPMGLAELCSYKYLVTGNGQVRT
jgi:glutamate-5-semialdehyde dehydrogenase